MFIVIESKHMEDSEENNFVIRTSDTVYSDIRFSFFPFQDNHEIILETKTVQSKKMLNNKLHVLFNVACSMSIRLSGKISSLSFFTSAFLSRYSTITNYDFKFLKISVYVRYLYR